MSTPLQTKNEPLEQKKNHLNHENDYSRPSFGFDQKVKENNQPEYVVVQSKKKKEVIQISSSEGEVMQIPEKRRIVEKVQYAQFKQDKTKKIKKVIFRCSLCKASGKKSEMKMCLNCKHNFHLACIQTEYGIPKRYVCDKCRFDKQQSIRQAQRKREIQERQLTLDLQKMLPKKTQKEKKKQESIKKFVEFRERYPYYIQEDKIKFPIQDKLLFIYRELFQYNQTLKTTPKAHPLIPCQLLGDFLQIQNFFSTFKQELILICQLPRDVRKSFLYIVMNNQGLDSTFQLLLACLLKLYLNDIFQKNKTDNVKMLNENCFFTLMINMNQNEELTGKFLILAAEEIIRYLSTIPSMKKAFERFEFPQKFNLNSKVELLVSLISGLSQVDTFHQLVSSKSQKMQNLTKQKGQLVTQLKSDEAQNLSNKQKLREINMVQLEMEQQLALEQNINNRQLSRQKDKNKKKLVKLVSQKDKSQSNIKEIKSKIHQISKSLPFVTSQLIFLGKDRNQSLYFFFCEQPNRIYCQYHNYVLDENPKFYLYEGKQSINELMKSLNIKGSNQKHLYDVIYSFIKEEIISATPAQNSYQNQTSLDKVSYQTDNQEITTQKVIDILLLSQETFSNYLALKNLQWAKENVRQSFLIDLKCVNSIIDLKQAVTNLQQSFLFVEAISDQPKVKLTILDSDEDQKNQKRQNVKKKSPVRLWGINSQRIKKYWIQYLQQCIDIKGIWICTTILKNYIDRYVKKKMEYFVEQQKKEEKQQKQKQKQRLRKEKQEKSSQKHSRDRSRDEKPKKGRSRKMSQQIEPSEDSYKRRPNLRQRKAKKLQIVQINLTKDSDIQYGSQDVEADMEDASVEYQDSNSDDCCQICGEYGQMICCDTCPKVFHLECLKIKQIPQGEWVCVHCLQKMANQRQTRSRLTRQAKNY